MTPQAAANAAVPGTAAFSNASGTLPAQRGGAKALLLTVLGEFVLPSGGAAWTTSLVTAAATLGIGEKNARQAIARIGDQGLIEGQRHGRAVRWSLSGAGHELLESGTQRIYSFATKTVDWNGQWLLAHCPIPEQQRAVRGRLRTELGFLGFGELSASLLVSPHVGSEPELRRVLGELGLAADSIIMRSMIEADETEALVTRAWDLDELADGYRGFSRHAEHLSPSGPEATFSAVVELVHEWRRFPFADPELPTELLPADWAGTAAARVFHQRHTEWSSTARAWFAELEAGQATPS